MFVQLTNHTQFLSWNQPVLSYEGKVSCSRKQQEPLMWFEQDAEKIHLILSPWQVVLHAGQANIFTDYAFFSCFLPIPW